MSAVSTNTPAAGPGSGDPSASSGPDPSSGSGRARGWIRDWRPEDSGFWSATGRSIAVRNLIFSIFAEHLGFLIWLLWSVVVVSLPGAGFTFSVDQLFWLVAIPNLVGSALRLPYTFAVTRFGGRNWTVISALLLVIPVGLLTVAVTDPATPFWAFVLIAATAGLGGGNFASSMTNISFFFPERRKGFALGLNAAGGNAGTSVVQLVVPLVVAGVGLTFAGLVWLPFIMLAAICAWLFMDNLAVARTPLSVQLAAAKRPDTWVMSFLYIGTFGSFVGYTAAFPLLAKTSFPATGLTSIAFLGALLGSVVRPLGGWLADRIGGARITLAVFAAMVAGMLGVLMSLEIDSVGLFLSSFALLFAASGVGNGSTYRMIPALFHAQGIRTGDTAGARAEGAACLGIAGAIGAFGGFLIPRAYGSSVAATGAVNAAVWAYIGFYLICLLVTWWCYLRPQLIAAEPEVSSA